MSESENSPTRIVAGGLFALFCAFIIAALALFGVISVTLGHIFMAAAGVVGALLIWTEIIPSKPPKNKVMFTILLWCLLGGADRLIVRHKNSEAVETVKPASAPRDPDLILSIVGGDIFLPQTHPSWTAFAMDVRIRNAGFPSIATDWAMTVTTPDGGTWKGQIETPPEKLNLGKAGGVLTKADFLLESLASRSPMLAGQPPVQSRILFYVDKRRDELLKPGSTIEISAADLSGKRYQATQSVGNWIQTTSQGSNPCPHGGITFTDSLNVNTDTAFYIKGNPPCPITITRPTIIGGKTGLLVDPSRDRSNTK